MSSVRFDPTFIHLQTLATARVFVDSEGLIYDAALNQTNVGGNNNKVGCHV